MNSQCVMQVADFDALYTGNFISSLTHLKNAVADRLGLDTIFVFVETARGRPWLQSLRDQGIQVAFVDRRAPFGDRVRSLASMARGCRAALLHSHFDLLDIDVALAGRHVRAPVVWHVHSQFSERPIRTRKALKQQFYESIKWRLVSPIFVDRIVAVSSSVAEVTMAQGGPPAKVDVVHSGIDGARVRAADPSLRIGMRRRYGISGDETVFLLFGWLPRTKGVDLFVRAAGILASSSGTAYRCFIVSGEHNEALLLEQTRDVPSIRVVRPVENVAELYALADCFVSASRSEGAPYAIGEAMASGLPVVSSDLASVSEIYGPSGAGLIRFRSEDVQRLVEALRFVMRASPEERRRLGESNRRFVETTLSMNRWCDEMVKMYYPLLG